jgi:hypothetical protein
MTVIMVLLTFGIFLLVDFGRGQKQLAKQPALRTAHREVAARVVPSMVAGFQVPENVRYHSWNKRLSAGHTWALSESRGLVRVGMDEFASKLVGRIESIVLPNAGAGSARGKRFERFPRRKIRWTWFRRLKAS